MSAGLSTNVVLAAAGTPIKRNKSHNINGVTFDSLCTLAQFPIVSPGAGVARTTIQARAYIANAYKISKVGVYCSAIDAVTGDSLNIVVGAGTANASGALNNTAPLDTQEIYGYPTAFAAAGNLVFGTDLAFTVANFPNLATGTGGDNQFEPTNSAGQPNYDGCYLPGLLTLRAVTNASTGSITNLLVVVFGCYIDTNCASNLDAQPTVDY